MSEVCWEAEWTDSIMNTKEKIVDRSLQQDWVTKLYPKFCTSYEALLSQLLENGKTLAQFVNTHVHLKWLKKKAIIKKDTSFVWRLLKECGWR